MNNAIRLVSTRNNTFSLLAFLAAAAMSAFVAQAQVVTLTDGNSRASVNLQGPGTLGMNSWTVNDINQLSQQWFWYRVGATPQQPINTLGGLTYSSAGNYLTATYNANGFSIRVDYQLSGGMPGGSDWTSDITETISVQNRSATQLNFHFFQYSDFDLLGTPGGDSVTIFNNGSGYNRATQTKGATRISETIDSPAATRAEAALFGQTLANLNGGVYDLNNNVTAGPDNVTWALQWDHLLNPNETWIVFKDKFLSVEPIPEPGFLGLAALGLAAFALRRARRA